MTHCNTLRHTRAPDLDEAVLQHTVTCCQHIATYCNTLQHTRPPDPAEAVLQHPAKLALVAIDRALMLLPNRCVCVYIYTYKEILMHVCVYIRRYICMALVPSTAPISSTAPICCAIDSAHILEPQTSTCSHVPRHVNIYVRMYVCMRVCVCVCVCLNSYNNLYIQYTCAYVYACV